MLWNELGGSFAPTRLAYELAARGHRVLFLEHRASDTRNTRGLPISIASPDEFGLPPLAISLAWRGVPLGSLDEITPRLAQWLNENESQDARQHEARVAILNAPFAPFARLIPFLQARGYWIVYYPQDDYGAMFDLGMSQFNPRLEEYLVAHADLDLTLAPAVAEKWKQTGREAAVVPDAFDPREFENAAADAPNVLRGEVTLGFWGSIMTPMVDAELVRAVAQAKPQWTFNLLGPYGTSPQYPSLYEQLRDLPNVRFHGLVARSELKNYARAFDVCVIPAPDNAMSRGRDPIKLYEYLACYKPVIAAHMPQLQGAPYTHIAYTAEEFIAFVERARAESINQTVIDSFLAAHTWSMRAETLLQHLSSMTRQPRAQHGESDANELERLERAQPIGKLEASEWDALMYAVREHPKLARELTSVQQWARELEAAQLAPPSLPTRLKELFLPR